MNVVRSGRFGPIYGAALLLALHSAFTVYINSNYLSAYLSEQSIDILYTTAALEALLVLILVPVLIRRFGVLPLFTFALIAQVIALAGLSSSQEAAHLALFFVLYQFLPTLLYFCMDIYLEGAIKTERVTGRIRSNYLTIMNCAYVVSPLLVGLIVSMTSYRFVYFLAAVFITFMFLVVVRRFKHRRIHSFRNVDFGASIAAFPRRKGLVKVFGLNFLLYCFFAAMVIYTPLYLHKIIGFDWPTIGVLFTIMLLPFALFEAPLGRLFDRAHQEHNVITLGFFIMIFATMAMFAFHTHSVVVWTIMLFASRVGASFVEIGTEYSFFKRVNDRDAGLISVYRMAAPISYVIAPLVAGIVSAIFSIEYVFLAVSVAMIIGLLTASTLKKPLDTASGS